MASFQPCVQYTYPDPEDKIALSYARSNEPYQGYWQQSENYALAFAEEIIRKRKKTKRLLDYGCGCGRHFRRYSRQFPEVLGIEPDMVRATVAGHKILVEELSNVSVIQGSLHDIDLPTGYFDTVLCSHVIQHISTTELEYVISNLQRVLNSRGILVLTTAHSKRHFDTYRCTLIEGTILTCRELTEMQFNELISGNVKMLPIHLFSITTLKKFIRKYFSVIALRVFNEFYPYCFVDRIVFRDRLINLPMLQDFFGGDVMFVATSKG